MRSSLPVAGNAAASQARQPDLVPELAAVIEGLLEHHVDVDVGFESLRERALLERAAAVLARARQEGGRP